MVTNGLHDLCLKFLAELGVVFEDFLAGVATLSEFRTLIAEPRTRLLDDAIFYTEVEEFANLRDAFAEGNLKLCLAEGRCHFVLHYLHAHLVAYDLIAILQRRDLTDVEAHRSIELQGVTTSCGLGVAEHHANLLAKLVNEDTGGVGLGDGRRELAQCLAHQAGMQAYGRVAHVAFDFLLRCECCDGVDDDDINRCRTNELVGNLESLLAVVWLRNPEIINIYAKFLCIEAVESVLGIDEGSRTTSLLTFCYSMDSQGCLT